jgi:hypothetical protein
LRLEELNIFTEDDSEELRPASYEGRMCTSKPPFICEGQTRWAESALSILADHHGLGTRHHSGYSRHRVENERPGPIANFPHPCASKSAGYPQANQMRKYSVCAQARANKHY